jgi:FkbM family methyltransferase
MNTITFRNQTINYVEREPFWKTVEAGEWESASFDVLDQYIQLGKVFIDIGAWVGALSLYAAKLGAIVHAIEPDSKAKDELINSFYYNTLPLGANVSHVAIADKNGMTEINSMTEDGLGNSESSLINRGIIGQSQKVKCYTLSSYIEHHDINPYNICLIKIDTEGSELLIIPGAIEWLRKYKPTIYISFHPGWFPDLNAAIEMFINLLFPIYNFIGVSKWGKVYTDKDFIAAMHTGNEHSFILKAK